VYIFVARPEGAATLLYPSEGHGAFVDSNREVVIPATGQVFELDDSPGTETFWVVGSTRPLSADDSSMENVGRALIGRRPTGPSTKVNPVARRATTAKPVAGGSRAPGLAPATKATALLPDLAGLNTRGIIVRRERALVVLSPDKAGVVSAPFWLNHVARR
jgi:hypothetical protein